GRSAGVVAVHLGGDRRRHRGAADLHTANDGRSHCQGRRSVGQHAQASTSAAASDGKTAAAAGPRRVVNVLAMTTQMARACGSDMRKLIRTAWSLAFLAVACNS